MLTEWKRQKMRRGDTFSPPKHPQLKISYLQVKGVNDQPQHPNSPKDSQLFKHILHHRAAYRKHTPATSTEEVIKSPGLCHLSWECGLLDDTNASCPLSGLKCHKFYTHSFQADICLYCHLHFSCSHSLSSVLSLKKITVDSKVHIWQSDDLRGKSTTLDGPEEVKHGTRPQFNEAIVDTQRSHHL